MSAFMVSEKSLATIAGAMICTLNTSRAAGRSAGFDESSVAAIVTACASVPDDKKKIVCGSLTNEPNLFFALYDLNAQALKARYNDVYDLPDQSPDGYPHVSPEPQRQRGV